MSDYGVFEASSTDGYEEDQRQRQATRDLGRAIEAAREGFGDFLGAATDKQDYQDRLALVMNDLMQKVADSGVMPVPGVMRKVKAALRPEFRQAANEEALEWAENYYQRNKTGDGVDTWKDALGLAGDEFGTNFTAEDYARHSSRKQAYDKGQAAQAAAAWAEDLGYNDPWGFASWLVDKGPRYLSPMSDSEYQTHLQLFQEADDPGVYGSRKQASIEDLRSYVESKGVTTSDKDNGFTFPTSDGAKGYVSENRNGDIVVQTLIGGSGGGVQSNYSKDEVDLVKQWIDRTASRKQADVHWYDQNGRQEAHFAGGEHITVFPDGKWEVSTGAFLDSGQAPSVEQAKAESLEALSLLAFGSRKKSRRKHADDYVKGDALNFINHLQNGGYRMPKDAGYPGEGGQMDDELYDYTNGDQNRISEITRFLQENWDYYAYGASRKRAGAGNWEQSYDGSDEWKLTGNPQVVIMSEDDGFYLFNGVELVEVTDTLEQAMDLGESSHVAKRKTAVPKENLIFDSLSELLLNGSLSAEDQDAIERAYGQGEQGKWEAAYNSVTFVADGPDLGSWEDGLVEAILDGIEDLVGDPSRSAAKKEDLRPGQKVSVGGRNGRIDEIRGDRITVAFPGGGIDFFRADQINTTLASRKGERKQALELGEWEEDLPGLGYAKATKTPGGGWEVYIWDEAGQNETLTPVNSSEEARRLFYDIINSYPGSGFDHIDF